MKRKVCLVTGASRGIGREIAIDLSKDYDLIINYGGSKDKALEVQKICEANGSNTLVYQCDVSNMEQVEKMYEEIIKKYGRIDVVVNNAGIAHGAPITSMTEELWDKVLDINLKGVFNSCKFASKYMKEQKSGRIINMSSVLGMVGSANLTNYSASKAGVIGLTKALAKELGQYEVTVNAVAPGYIVTDMTDQFDENTNKKIMAMLPIKRFGKPEDISNMVMFLASDKSNYITGQIISVNGGLVI